MKPVHFPEANCAFGTNQPEYNALPANRSEGPEGMVTSCWEVEPDDLTALMAAVMQGEKAVIWVGQLTFHQDLQPIRLSVERPTFEELPPEGTLRERES
jgi:hypothetical protein